MNSRIVFAGTLLAGLCASASVPTVSNVTTTQDVSRRVTVNYTLSGEAGIVTLTAQTNRGDDVWVDVGDDALSYAAGDVNKVVEPGNRSLTWLPHKSWPDHFITGGKIRIGVKAWAKDAPPDYMVVSLVTPSNKWFYASAGAIPGGVQDEKYKTDYLVLRKCPAANVTWRMGSPTTESSRTAGNEVPHEVTLSNDYYIGVYLITQRQWELLTGERPSAFKKDYLTRALDKGCSYELIRGSTASTGAYYWPVKGHAVDPTSFMGKLRAKTGVEFDLPTDAQWEFASRAGCGSALYDGTELETNADGVSANLSRLARYNKNGGSLPSGMSEADCPVEYGPPSVGSYAPNAWGIYDTLGTIWEWCLDKFTEDLTKDDPYYKSPTRKIDPETGPWSTSTANRVLRGGQRASAAGSCRCASRSYGNVANANGGGFRVACPATVE